MIFEVLNAGPILRTTHPVSLWVRGAIPTIHAPQYCAVSVEAAVRFAECDAFKDGRDWIRTIEVYTKDSSSADYADRMVYTTHTIRR